MAKPTKMTFPRSAIQREGKKKHKPISPACSCGCETARFLGRNSVVVCTGYGQAITALHNPKDRFRIIEAYGPASTAAMQSGVGRERRGQLAHFRSL
jgi:hypothetical protein